MSEIGAGGILKAFRSMNTDTATNLGIERDNPAWISFSFEGYFSGGWKVQYCAVACICVSHFSDEMMKGRMLACEHGPTGVRAHEFYDFDGALIDRSLGDRGAGSKKVMANHLTGLATSQKQGRPRLKNDYPISDQELVDLIDNSGDWFEHSENGREFKPQPQDAVEQLARKYGMITIDSSDKDSEVARNDMWRRYRREKRRKK